MIFGASRSAFAARCRFYRDDTRRLFIVWNSALPGAEVYRGVTPFHPDRFKYTSDALGPGQCGELDYPRRAFKLDVPRAGVTGDHTDGTPEDFAGLAVVPPLNPDGTVISPPPCALIPAGPIPWLYARSVLVDGVTQCT